MTSSADVRDIQPNNLPNIAVLDRASFPDEKRLPLVRTFVADRSDVLSLVATDGHVIIDLFNFTFSTISRDD